MADQVYALIEEKMPLFRRGVNYLASITLGAIALGPTVTPPARKWHIVRKRDGSIAGEIVEGFGETTDVGADLAADLSSLTVTEFEDQWLVRT